MLVCLLFAMGVYRHAIFQMKETRDKALKMAMGTWLALALGAAKTVLKF